MAHMIKGYSCGCRQAVIVKNEDYLGQNKLCEQLLISENSANFKSDGCGFELDNAAKSIFASLSDGDIVEISERGLINQTFNAYDSDATIFMTGNCNSNCIMCPASDYERKIEYGDRTSILKEYISMLPADLRNYVVTGGEPTMNPEQFLDIMGLLADQFPQAEGLLLTNGRSFSVLSFLNEMLKHCPPYLTVAIPLHGSTAELHDAITRADGSFRQTFRGIRNLLNRKISVEIRIVVTRINQKDISNLCRMIADEYPDTFRVNFISLEVRGNCYIHRDEVYIEPHESFLASKTGIKILIEKGIDVGLYNYPLCCVDSGYQFLCKKSISHEKVRFSSECASCRIRDYCGGMFVSTLKATKPKLYPYR